LDAKTLADEWEKCSHLRLPKSKCTLLVLCLGGISSFLDIQGTNVAGVAVYFASNQTIRWPSQEESEDMMTWKEAQVPANMDIVVLTVEVGLSFLFSKISLSFYLHHVGGEKTYHRPKLSAVGQQGCNRVFEKLERPRH